ncbi:hypothetical protein BK662_24385 [Pseudomonas frederiksbergensis]|uniref:Uncharacterized protein n=1 Tax=Pseudomonas frederiksbergensis TaxID=104087 RepID=A0A423HM34_9PSED|nr:hypothetical protein BK662_18310 [Pseudomonas frederiksbergensis]RON14254.1 hypothetical protein BK662_24385 [Pseudomonas frederiksbergensis]
MIFSSVRCVMELGRRPDAAPARVVGKTRRAIFASFSNGLWSVTAVAYRPGTNGVHAQHMPALPPQAKVIA